MKTIMKTPPMGWNSYDYYDTTVTEKDIRANADYMAKYMKAYGWEYIVVDIEWYSKQAGQDRDKYQYVPFAKFQMDEYSRLLPDEDRFPSAKEGKGFGPLADYVHGLGLKFGIHIMRGIPRCATYFRTKIKGTDFTANDIADPYSICYWNPDMYGVNPKAEGAQAYYDSLLELYASWGVDFIKCDDICRMDAESSQQEIEMLHKAIERCGREIVLSLSPGPALVEKHEFYHENANMWRITDDFWDHWESLRDMFDRCKNWQEYVKDGGYPDCDMLPLGKLGKGFGKERDTYFTIEEQKTMMSLWTIFRSPLMIGAELTMLDEQTLELLTNKELYEMYQNARGAREVFRSEEIIIWQAASEEKQYTAFFNLTEKDMAVPAEWLDKLCDNTRELWSGKMFSEKENWKISPHGVLLFSIDGEV